MNQFSSLHYLLVRFVPTLLVRLQDGELRQREDESGALLPGLAVPPDLLRVRGLLLPLHRNLYVCCSVEIFSEVPHNTLSFQALCMEYRRQPSSIAHPAYPTHLLRAVYHLRHLRRCRSTPLLLPSTHLSFTIDPLLRRPRALLRELPVEARGEAVLLLRLHVQRQAVPGRRVLRRGMRRAQGQDRQVAPLDRDFQGRAQAAEALRRGHRAVGHCPGRARRLLVARGVRGDGRVRRREEKGGDEPTLCAVWWLPACRVLSARCAVVRGCVVCAVLCAVRYVWLQTRTNAVLLPVSPRYPGAIQSTFDTIEYRRDGKYSIRLFNRPADKWEHVLVDDRFPCDAESGKPLFTSPKGEELWVLLLEKAFAKFCGGYVGRCVVVGVVW